MVSAFGKLRRVEENVGNYNEISRVKIMVESCDLLKIPSILPLIHNGITYPVKVVPEIDDLQFAKLEADEHEVDDELTHQIGEARSYADVVGKDLRVQVACEYGENSRAQLTLIEVRDKTNEIQYQLDPAHEDEGSIGPIVPDTYDKPHLNEQTNGSKDLSSENEIPHLVTDLEEENWGYASSSSEEVEVDASDDEQLLIESLQQYDDAMSVGLEVSSRTLEFQFSEEPLVVGLQETKREDYNSRFTRHIYGAKTTWLGSRSVDWKIRRYVGVMGYRGVVVEDSIKGAFSLLILRTMLKSRFSWVFTTVYGPVDMADKGQF
ncbi:hypothetical protein IFM89_039911 [Coptis chinensis]|uniref:Uncharacterized protein n=1 Tax=Coptis chinensis TaxID=261450 RepID=A0A835LA79_9MAGN|nr:hypothetical protein IFM89_039911 [Coptis chinensis]